MKIIIIGAGISGCTLYLQLLKHLPPPAPGTSHSITIYEAYDTNINTTPEDRPQGPTHSSTLIVGGGLGIGANGMNVLKRLDEELVRDVVRGGYVVDHSNLKSKSGRLLVRMAAKMDGGGMCMVASSRHSLWRCLRSRVPDGVIVNKRVSGVIANAEGRNVVMFMDGSPDEEADLVIGADGVKSTVKTALFPEAEEDPYPPHYEGLVGVGGFIPSSSLRSHVEKGSMNFIFGGNGFFGYFFSNSSPSDPNRDSPYSTSEPGDSISWWSTYSISSCPNTKTIDKDDIVRQLRQRHSEWGDPVVQKIIHSVDVDSMYPTWTSPELPTWERDGVVLVGDAAHALPSTSGQGSSQAIEDGEAFALFLAFYLKRGYDGEFVMTEKEAIKIAAKRYMELRQPHVKCILEEAQKMQNTKRDMGVFREYLMNCVLWVFGFFPSILSRHVKAVMEYNVADEVQKVLEES